ncbi:TPA: FKBP-type peptidyl-prolyl cis-trans isomerase [Thermoplasmata archaeon]|nr:FKBP-type peptidyl-prolyl cis-trans isomerase [Thermoplasmata archaeon]
MFLVLVAVAVVVSVGVVGYVVYDNSQGHSTGVSDPIEMGDIVSMDYTGSFSSGRVFDTSLLDVATDDVVYPKSLTFNLRDNDSYKPFDMTAGLYNAEGGTIKGFALGVLGLRVGDTHTIEVLPEDGYAVDPAMIESVEVVQHIDATETMSETNFRSLFNIEPVVMDRVPHYIWKWDVLVLDVGFNVVTYKHVPDVGQVVYPFGDPTDDEDPSGWACSVESYSPSANDGIGEVVVRHQVTEDDVYEVKGTLYTGQTFILSGYDAENGTLEIHKSNPETGYNGEISGRTLYFEVTILAVVPAT